MKRYGVFILVLSAVFSGLLWLVVQVEPEADPIVEVAQAPVQEAVPAPTPVPNETTRAVGVMSALEQMEVAFIGNPRQAEIRAILDRALALYNTPISEENYSRAGSALVALRQKLGPSEMDILDYMIRSHVPGAKYELPRHGRH